jgi:hypothetical protein
MIKLQEKTLGQATKDNYDHMVNKLKTGTTITRSFSQQKRQVSSSQDTREGEGLKAYQML